MHFLLSQSMRIYHAREVHLFRYCIVKINKTLLFHRPELRITHEVGFLFFLELFLLFYIIKVSLLLGFRNWKNRNRLRVCLFFLQNNYLIYLDQYTI